MTRRRTETVTSHVVLTGLGGLDTLVCENCGAASLVPALPLRVLDLAARLTAFLAKHRGCRPAEGRT